MKLIIFKKDKYRPPEFLACLLHPHVPEEAADFFFENVPLMDFGYERWESFGPAFHDVLQAEVSEQKTLKFLEWTAPRDEVEVKDA